MNLKEFRSQYPQYNDLSDQELATGLHKKFYSDIPFDTFMKQVGGARAAEDVGIIEGAKTALGRGFESFGDIASGFGLAGSSVFGSDEATRRRMAAIKADQEKEAQEGAATPLMTVKDFERIAAEKGVLEAAKEAPKYILEQLGLSGPQMAVPLAVGAGTSAVAGPVIGTIAGIGTYGLQQFGNFLVRQAVEKDDPKELEVAKAALTAGGTAPIGYFVDRFTVGLGNIGKNAGAQAAKELTARQIAAQTGKRVAEGATLGIIAEAPTEVLESVAERWQAGLDLTGQDAYDEYKEAFFGAAAIGGGIGGATRGYAGYKEASARPPAPAAPEEEPTPEEKLALGYSPLAGTPVVFPDGTVALSSEQELAKRYQAPEARTPEQMDMFAADKEREEISQRFRQRYGEPQPGETALAGTDIGPPTPEAEFPTKLTADLLDELGLSKRSPFYKQLDGKDLTNPDDQKDIGEILARVRANPNIAESTKTGLERVAMQGFGAAATQQELFVTKGRKKGEPTPGALRTGEVEAEPAAEETGQGDLFEDTTPVPEYREITEEDLKGMGVGPTNKKLREQILGKNLDDPTERQEVIEALDAFGSDPNRSPKVAKAVEDFLDGLGFRREGDGADRATIPGAVEPSVPVSEQPRGEPAAGVEPPVVEGLGVDRPDVKPSDARKETAPPTVRPKTLDEANLALAQYVQQVGSVEGALDRMAGEIAFERKLNRVNKVAQKGLSQQQKEVLNRKVKEYRFKAEQGTKAAQRYLKHRSATPGQKGNPKDVVERQVQRLTQGWVNAPKIEVVQSISELPDYMQQEIRDAGVNPKGAFDPRTESVFIVADNVTGYNDLTVTVAHEAIGHYGLRAVLGGQYSKVLNDLYRTNDQVKAKADIKIKEGLDKDTAIEEVLAEAVEEKVPANTAMGRAVQRLKNILRRVMRAFGVSTLNDKDVQGLLDSFAAYVVKGKGTRGEGRAGAETAFKGDGLEIREGEAAWTPKRINDLLSTWAYTNDRGDTKAYAGFVNPEDFLRATSTAAYREDVLEKENRPLDTEKIAGEIQPIFLQVEIDKLNQDDVAKIIGHEGRHRMMALRDAGVTKVPVVFLNGYAGQRVSDAKPMPGMVLLQESIGERSFTVRDLVPLSYDYRDQIRQTFGSPAAQVVFRKAAPVLTPEGQKAQATVNKMKGISNEKPKVPEKSTIGKVSAFFMDPSFRQDQIDKLRVQVAYKGASVERKLMDKFNGKIRDSLGNIRPDVFMTAAEHSDTMTVAALKQGTLYLNKNIGWDVKKGPHTLEGAMGTVRKLGEKLGDVDLAFKLANDAFIARRANTLKNHPDKDVFNLPSQDKIDAGLQAFKDFPELEKAFQEFTGFKNGLIDAMVEGGRLSPEQAKSWKDAIDYVPWNRIRDYEENAQTSPKGYFKGLVNLGQMGKLTGSENEINNVFDNMVGLSFWMTNSAIRNHAALNLVDTFNRFNLGIRPVREGQSGVDPNKTIYIYRDGKPEAYELESLADVYAFKGVESMSMPILKSLASFANFLRKATTATPQFAASQLFQDSYRATVMSGTKSPFKTAANVLTGFKDAYFGDETTRRLEQMGIVGMYDLMPGRVKEDIEKEFGIRQRGVTEKALNFMESFSIASDAALRKSVFERTLEETKSEAFPEGDVLLARYRAQEVINFKRQGANRAVGVLRQVVPFMNAYIQGMDVFYRSMTGRGIAADERAAATKLFWKTGAKLATLSLIYSMMVGDDDEYEGLRDFEKDKNFIFPGTGVKIPVAPEVGFLFKVIPERVYQYVTSQGTERPQDATALRKALATAGFDAISGPNLTPQFLKPTLEASLNYSFFTNTPIVGRGLEQRESSQQFTANTAELAKMFGELTGISPMKMEYIFRGYTGIAGGTLLDMTNMMFTNRADKHLYELPGFKTFMYDKIPGGYKEQYYDLRDRVTEVNATINGMVADGRADELMPYLTDEKLNKYALVQTMNEIDQNLEDFRAMRKLVAGDKTMSGEQKRKIIDDIEQTENQMLKFYNVPMMRKKIAGL